MEKQGEQWRHLGPDQSWGWLVVAPPRFSSSCSCSGALASVLQDCCAAMHACVQSMHACTWRRIGTGGTRGVHPSIHSRSGGGRETAVVSTICSIWLGEGCRGGGGGFAIRRWLVWAGWRQGICNSGVGRWERWIAGWCWVVALRFCDDSLVYSAPLYFFLHA